MIIKNLLNPFGESLLNQCKECSDFGQLKVGIKLIFNFILNLKWILFVNNINTKNI